MYDHIFVCQVFVCVGLINLGLSLPLRYDVLNHAPYIFEKPERKHFMGKMFIGMGSTRQNSNLVLTIVIGWHGFKAPLNGKHGGLTKN